MKKHVIFLVAFLGSVVLFSQVGINTDDPQGILEIKNTTQNLGFVLPKVSKADDVTTPNGSVPVEATLVYDVEKECIRLKKTLNWSGCLIDETKLEEVIGLLVDGKTFWLTSDYLDVTPEYMQNKFSHHDVSSLFSNIADNDYLFGAGYSSNGLGLGGNNQIINPAKRVLDKKILTMAGSVGFSIEGGILSGLGAQILVTDDGKVLVSGRNNSGRLGLDTNLFDINSNVREWLEVSIPGMDADEKAIQVQSNSLATIILSDKGRVYAAGSNYYGHTGQGSSGLLSGNTEQFTEVEFPGLALNDEIESIWGTFENSGAESMFTAITKNGKVYAWGRRYYQGPWGNSTYIPVINPGGNGGWNDVPQDITNFFIVNGQQVSVKKVLIGTQALMALSDDGRIYASVAQGSRNYRIGMGSSNSGTNNLRDITTTVKSINLLNGADIVDFDLDVDGAVIISSTDLIVAGFAYNYRFGNNIEELFQVWPFAPDASNWKKVDNYYFNGEYTLKSVDLGANSLFVGTQERFILVSGANNNKVLGTADGTGVLGNDNIESTSLATF